MVLTAVPAFPDPRVSRVLDFAEAPVGHVVDEAAHGDFFGDPGMGAQLLELVTDVFFDVLEGVEEGRSDGGGSGAVLDLRAQILFGRVHQAAIGVVDDHDFLGAQQVMRDHQGAQGIVGDDAAGIADDVRITRFQAEGANRKPRVHACQDGELALWPRGEFAQLVRARVDFVGGEDFINDAHGQKSLPKAKRVGSLQAS